jgi:hypothetical protein
VSFSQDSASRNGGIGDVYFQDGYKLISAEQLVGAVDALNEREITFRAFRVLVGCFELLAVREAAERSRATSGKKPQRRFLRSELEQLIRAREGTTVARELSSLKAAGLLTFTESAIEPSSGEPRNTNLLGLLGSRGGKRLIPVPRHALKFLAACTRPALAKTVVAYLLRGLSLQRDGKIRSAGTVKISWICKLCHISERAARAARAELIRLGWITKDTGSFQRKLNRDGAYFVINPAWRRVQKRFAPLGREKCTRSAPPREKQETPYGSKNQKLAPRAEAGVCTANRNEVLGRPMLRDIKLADLERLSWLRALYEQATAAKWLSHSEANFRNFVAAAARATRVNGDAVRIFVGIVRRGLWHHLTTADEDRATRALQRERERHTRLNAQREAAPQISEGEKGEGMIRLVLDLAMRRSTTGDPYTEGRLAPAIDTPKMP